MQEIEDNFKSNGGKFEEFRIGDLFDIQTGSLIDSSLLVSGSLKRISAKSDNNGVLGSYNTQNLAEARHYENFISVNFFGDTFYHPYKASVEMKVHTLHLKKHIFNSKTGLYIAGVISKIFKGKFSYGNQLSSSKLKKEDYYITLPTQNGEIAFDYMEAYIKELEADRVKELEAYLIATGLKDYTLTAAEQTALEVFEKSIKINNLTQMGGGKPYLPAVDFQTFKIGDLFEKISRGDIFQQGNLHDNESGINFIAQNDTNNGFVKKVSSDNYKVFSENSIVIGRQTGISYYQKEKFVTTDGVLVIDNPKLIHNKYNGLFVTSLLQKQLSVFCYTNTVSAKKLQEVKIQLPTQNNAIDFDFMHSFIRAIEKIVIKEVVEWADIVKQLQNRKI